jgi:hypothetical protein
MTNFVYDYNVHYTATHKDRMMQHTSIVACDNWQEEIAKKTMDLDSVNWTISVMVIGATYNAKTPMHKYQIVNNVLTLMI